MSLPDAAYFVASSRLRPGLDGGFTIATMQRAGDLAAAGADVTLLTFDPAPIDGVLDAFIALGLATPATRYRNLFAELRARPELVREAALHPVEDGAGRQIERHQTAPGGNRLPRAASPAITDRDGMNARAHDPRSTLITDGSGAPLLRLPFIDAVDWHRSDAGLEVYAADGMTLGALRGFGELYRLWVDAVTAEAVARETVVMVEARSIGELLGPHPHDYALVHTVHSMHTESPHRWDSTMDTLWSGWFDAVPTFDAVLWPTRAQRADVVRRFGEDYGPADRWFVVPHPARPLPALDAPAREPLLGMMIAGLRPLKRIDDAIRAWAEVVRQLPGARLEIIGDGPMRAELESLIAELGLHAAITLHGHVPSAAAELGRASLLLLTSRYEGQSLAVVEALAAGTPVVAYDIPYGPAEMLADSGGGVAVPSGDLAALAAAIVETLGDPELIARRSAAGRAWAAAHGPTESMAATAQAVRAALARRD